MVSDLHLEAMVRESKDGMVVAVPQPMFQDLAGELMSLRREAKRWRPKCANYRKAIKGLERCVDGHKAAVYNSVARASEEHEKKYAEA